MLITDIAMLAVAKDELSIYTGVVCLGRTEARTGDVATVVSAIGGHAIAGQYPYFPLSLLHETGV